MKTRLALLIVALMTIIGLMRADEVVTVSSTSTDISENLDLKAVANLFGQVKNLEEFEQELNSEESHLNNLDLNGDGLIDYLRVVEMESEGRHLIIIQAVLAKDVYQDVACIYVEKDEADQVTVQVVGDEYIYGANYIIEPVYIYRPLLWDWFWASTWTCWSSPWYWNYYPSWWCYSCAPWTPYAYYHHICNYHYHHYGCTYHYASAPHHGMREMRLSDRGRSLSRREFATTNPGRSFSVRNAGYTNARSIDARRSTAYRESVGRSIQDGSIGARRTGTFGTSASSRGSIVTTATRVGGSRALNTNKSRNTNAGVTTFGSSFARRSTTNTSRSSEATTNTGRSAVTTSTTPRRTAATGSRTSTPARTSTYNSNSYGKRSAATSTTSTRSSSSTTRAVSTPARSSSSTTRTVSTPTRSSTYSGSSSTRSGSYSGSSSRGSYSGSSSSHSGGYSGSSRRR